MNKIKEIITNPQKSEMGSGFGYLEGVGGHTLKEVLEYCAKNFKCYGVVCIHRGNTIVRKFDYDTYTRGTYRFYHNLSEGMYQLPVKKVEFSYCYMGRDIDIYLN